MRNELPKLSTFAVLVFVFHSGTAFAQSGNRERVITKAPPKEPLRYLTNAEVRTTAVSSRSKTGHFRTAPSYIAPEPNKSNYSGVASPMPEYTSTVLPRR